MPLRPSLSAPLSISVPPRPNLVESSPTVYLLLLTRTLRQLRVWLGTDGILVAGLSVDDSDITAPTPMPKNAPPKAVRKTKAAGALTPQASLPRLWEYPSLVPVRRSRSWPAKESSTLVCLVMRSKHLPSLAWLLQLPELLVQLRRYLDEQC